MMWRHVHVSRNARWLLPVLTVLLFASGSAPEARAGRFPKPDPEQAFAEMKIYRQGSPLRTPREDWAGARRRVRADPAWQAWLRKQRRETDDWMQRRRDRVEWIAGWWHDFVSPKDGSFLIWTPDEPGEYTLHSPSDPRVKLTPKLHAAWVFVFRSRQMIQMLEAARLYRLTSEERYARWAASQLDFYTTNYLKWPLQPRPGARLMFQSLDEAVNLIRLARTVRLLGDYPETARRQRWFRQLFKPETELIDGTLHIIHNIACWQRVATACVALTFDQPELWQWAIEGPWGLRRQIAEGVTSDYLWYEQSLGYNNYVLAALRPLFIEAGVAGRLGALRHEMAVAENLMLAPIYLRFPNGQLPNPADSSGGLRKAPNERLLARAYRMFPTAYGLVRAAREHTWDTLLDPPERTKAMPPLPEPTSRNLESSRMAVLRRGPWQVFFHYGQLTGSHAQAEALNFEAFYERTDVTHDPGTVGYGSPLHREYYRSGLSHNVPLINGRGQKPWQPGELVAFDAQRGRVEARQPAYRPGVRATRELRIEGRTLIDRVEIATKAKEPLRLGLVLHVQGKIALPSGFEPAKDFASPNRPVGFKYWRNPRQAKFTNTVVLPVTFGDVKMSVRFRVPGPFTLTHALAPDVPPDVRHAVYLETSGTKTTFVTQFEPQ